MASYDSSSSPEQRSPRFTQWVAFLIFSIIVLAASVESSRSSSDAGKGTWAITCAAITLCISFVSVMMHLFPICSIYIVGSKLEGFLCFLLVTFWSAQVAVVTDPNFGLAVNSDGAVSNGNLYYFSWAGLVCAVLMEVSYLRDAWNVDVAGELRNRAVRLNLWSAMMATSFVVLGASANIFDHSCGKESSKFVGGRYCDRALFGLVLGCLSALLSLYVVVMKVVTRKTFFVVETLFATSFLIAFAFGVALITADGSPGAPLGNLYYFTWGAFFVSFMLCAGLYEEYNSIRNPQQSQQSQQQDGGGGMGNDVPVEALDATI